MTSNEAHSKAVQAVADLAKWGIKTVIHPSKLKDTEETKRFKGPERADSDQW